MFTFWKDNFDLTVWNLFHVKRKGRNVIKISNDREKDNSHNKLIYMFFLTYFSKRCQFSEHWNNAHNVATRANNFGISFSPMIARSRAIYLYSFRCKAARAIGSRLGETITMAFNWVEKQISFLLNIIRGTFTDAGGVVWWFDRLIVSFSVFRFLGSSWLVLGGCFWTRFWVNEPLEAHAIRGLRGEFWMAVCFSFR